MTLLSVWLLQFGSFAKAADTTATPQAHQPDIGLSSLILVPIATAQEDVQSCQTVSDNHHPALSINQAEVDMSTSHWLYTHSSPGKHAF